MKIRAGYDDCPQPTPMILTLSVHPSCFADLLTRIGCGSMGQGSLRQYGTPMLTRRVQIY